METPEPKKDRKTRTAIFANSKGGVGKSTLALLTCLGLASRFKRASVELIDLDSQSTSSDSLQKFANDRFSVIHDDHLFLASGSPNNGNIVNHIDSEPRNSERDSFLIFDSPAGSEPARSSFLLRCNLIFVPTSVSDADIHATKKYLQSLRDLFDRQNQQLSEVGSPSIVILPNMMDSREEYNELRQILADEPVYYGEPLYFSTVFRRAFRDEENDTNVKRLMLDSVEYVNWITTLILNSEKLNGADAKLFQL